MTLAHVHGQALRALEEDAVEDAARNGERVVAIAAPSPLSRVPADESRPVGRDDAHTVNRLRACRVHVLQDAQPVEQTRGLGREVRAADPRPRECRLVEKRDAHAALGEQDGRGGSRRAGPDHHDVRARHRLLRTANCRRSGG